MREIIIVTIFIFRKPRVGRPPKYIRLERPKLEPEDEPAEKKPKKKSIKLIKSEIMEPSEQDKARTFIEHSNMIPAERESWNRHSRFLKKYIRHDTDPRLWNYREVLSFISSIPCCEHNTEVFKRERIDGEALLSLSQKDILTILKFKVGPAVKLYNSIVLLRQQIKEEMCT